MTSDLLYALPLAAAGTALFVLTLAHGLRLASQGDQRYAGHILLCGIAGLMLIPITLRAWGG